MSRSRPSHTRHVPNRRARRHHSVPQLHLRQFAADPGRRFIFEHDKRTGETRRRAISRVAAQMDLYTVVDADGSPTDELERALGPLEAGAAPVLRRLSELTSGRIGATDDERGRLGAYVALQYSRLPDQLDQMHEISDYLGSAAMDILYGSAEHYRDYHRHRGSTASDEELEAERVAGLEMLRGGAWRVSGGRGDALSSIAIGVEAIGPIVASMHWTVLVRARAPWFVLGDTPVTLYNAHATRHMPPGFATEGTEVRMPISPTHAFLAMATETMVADRVLELASDEAAAGMTVEAWAYSVDAVYGHSEEAIQAARTATPEALRPYHERSSSIGGGPAGWDRYRRRPRRRRE
jgi:hypothetical protein